MKDCRRFERTYDLRDNLRRHVRVADGIGGGAPLTALLLALLGGEVTLARVVARVDVVATAKTHHLLTGTLGRRFGVPAGLMGTDEVVFALRADPLASDGVILETVEIGLSRPNVVEVDQGDDSGEPRGREVGVI